MILEATVAGRIKNNKIRAIQINDSTDVAYFAVSLFLRGIGKETRGKKNVCFATLCQSVQEVKICQRWWWWHIVYCPPML